MKSHFIKFAGALALVCGLLLHADAQPTVSATTDKKDYQIGDWITLELKVKHDPGQQVVFPLITDSLQELEVLEIGEVDSQTIKDRIIKKQLITLTVFDSGYYVIPPLSVKYKDPGSGDMVSLASEAFFVTVHTIPIDTAAAIKTIKNPLDVALTFEEIQYYVYGGLALLLLGFLGWYLWKKRKRNEDPFVRKAPQLPAHEVALRKLNELAAKKLWQKGEYKAYYSELTDIIREYLERRYGILAMESTTDEILDDLSGLITRPELKDPLRELLQQADLVKFAKARPLPDQNELAFRRGLDLVNETKISAVKEEEVNHVE